MNRKALCLLEQLQNAPAGMVVEIGTIRHATEAPKDGFSTVFLAHFCQVNGREFVSFDNCAEHVALANQVLIKNELSPVARLAHSAEALSELKPVGFLYLDGSDSPEEALEQMLRVPLVPDAVVVVDDCHNYHGRVFGKGTEIIRYLKCLNHPFALHATEPGFQSLVARAPPVLCHPAEKNDWKNTLMQNAAEIFSRQVPGSSTANGRGILMHAFSESDFLAAWVCAHVLSSVGCGLPIELFFLSDSAVTAEMQSLAQSIGLKCVSAKENQKLAQCDPLHSNIIAWAIESCSFREVLFLPPNTLPLRNPECVFDSQEYQESGILSWPSDKNVTHCSRDVHPLVIDKWRCRIPLALATDLPLSVSVGIEDCYTGLRNAWTMSGQEFAVALSENGDSLSNSIAKPESAVLFYSGNASHWTLDAPMPRALDFPYEEECFACLESLRLQWSEYKGMSFRSLKIKRELTNSVMLYVRVGFDYREVHLRPHGSIGKGTDRLERRWWLEEGPENNITLHIGDGTNTTCSLSSVAPGCWFGKWVSFEQMPIYLIHVRSAHE